MVDQVQLSRQALRFEPAGTYRFENVPLRLHGALRPQSIALTLRRDAGKLVGQVVTGDSTWKIDDIVAGGDRLWIFAQAYGAALELRLRVDGDAASGTWILGWANNGTLAGTR